MRTERSALLEQRSVLVENIECELFTPLIRGFSRLHLHRFRWIGNVAILVADEVPTVDFYNNKLLMITPLIPRFSFAAKIHCKAGHCGSTRNQLIADGHSGATTKLPLRLLPTFVSAHFCCTFDAMAIPLCKY